MVQLQRQTWARFPASNLVRSDIDQGITYTLTLIHMCTHEYVLCTEMLRTSAVDATLLLDPPLMGGVPVRDEQGSRST